MPKITVLPKNIAELIAAGEVVERPASVVKELCENAIDAGATRVIVELQGGGLRLIRVTDNGCGIAREDIRNAFRRNATSKVSSVEELYAIATLGFRGEALPSIAAMARVELLTRTADEVAGTRYVIEGGEETVLEDAGCPTGMTILVRDLFYNTPARLKFMKSNRTEASAASVLIEKLALSHPEIAFRLIRDGVEDFSTAGDGDIVGCARRVLGKEFADGLIPVELDEPPFSVRGYISRPESVRGSRSGQNVFINGRYVRSRTVSAALEEAYAGRVMVGRYPACLLYITMPFGAIDVNVHPSKLEIRFSQEKPIYELTSNAVRSALEQNRTYPKLVRPTPAQQYAAALHLQQSLPAKDAAELIASQMGKQEQLHFRADGAVREKTGAKPTVSASEKPAQSSFESPEPPLNLKKYLIPVDQNAPAEPPVPPCPVVAAELPVPPCPAVPAEPPVPPCPAVPAEPPVPPCPAIPAEPPVPPCPPVPEESPVPDMPPKPWRPSVPDEPPTLDFPPISEAHPGPEASCPTVSPFEDAVVSSVPECSVRILGEIFHTYIVAESGGSLLLVDKHAAHERLLYERLKSEDLRSCRQILLAPTVVKCARSDYALLSENLDTLERLGFLVEDFGGETLIVREVPAILAEDDVTEMILEIAGKLRLGNQALMPERMNDILHSIACRAAVKAHDESLLPELKHLMEQLLAHPELRNCPHGRPMYLEMTRHELEKQFGRLG